MFIQIETTADPATLRFIPDLRPIASGTREFHTEDAVESVPLARRLLALPGVLKIVLCPEYIGVTQANSDWSHLKPVILGTIMECLRDEPPDCVGSEAGTQHQRSESDVLSRIREGLRTVIDPELGYNIVDLGLVYDVSIDKGGVVQITMTTTTPGCPATNYLKSGASRSAAEIRGVSQVNVELTYDPRWTPEMMTADAKSHLGIR